MLVTRTMRAGGSAGVALARVWLSGERRRPKRHVRRGLTLPALADLSGRICDALWALVGIPVGGAQVHRPE
jgi:hypothetical protein